MSVSHIILIGLFYLLSKTLNLVVLFHEEVALVILNLLVDVLRMTCVALTHDSSWIS